MGARLAANLQQVPEARGGEEHDLAAPALNQRVRPHRGAVGKALELIRRDGMALGQLGEPGHDGACRIFGGGRALEHMDLPALAVPDVEIGEGASDVHADAPCGLRFTHRSLIPES